LGNAAAANILYRIEGGYLKGTAGFAIGSQGKGAVVQTGGTVDLMRFGEVLQLGGSPAGVGQGFYTISGGTLNAINNNACLQIGFWRAGCTGTMTIASAAVVNAKAIEFGSTANAVVGILNLSGGVFRVNNVYNSSALAVHAFNFSGGTLSPYNANATIGSATAAYNTTITLTGTNATISSSDKDGKKRKVTIWSKLTGSGGITFTGGGTNTLIAVNDYTGNTTLNGGTAVWSNACLSANSDLMCANGPKLVLAFNATNAIRKLFVNGGMQKSGVYNSGNAPAGMTIQGNGALLVTAGAAYGTFVAIK
jgi:hypothetical protein